jgi:hypothetical protein
MTRREAFEWGLIVAVVWAVSGPMVAMLPVVLYCGVRAVGLRRVL